MIKYTLMIDRKKCTDAAVKRLFSKLRQKKYIEMKLSSPNWTVQNSQAHRIWIEIEIPEKDTETWPDNLVNLVPQDSWACRQGHEAAEWAVSFIKKGD